MSTRSERYEVYTAFIREGDPSAVVSDLKKVEDQARKTGSGLDLSGKQAQAAGKQQAAAGRDFKGFSENLKAAAEATYKMGTGLQWANVPGAHFLMTAGNLLQGSDLLGQSLGKLTGGIPPLAVGLAVGTAAIIGFGVAMRAAAKSAEEFIGRIRDVSQMTGRSLEDTSRDLASMQGMFGAEGAMGVYSSITNAQANLSPMATMSQQAFSKLSPGYRPFAPDQFSRWGLSLVEQGSTPTDPRMKDPMDVLFEAAKRGNQLDPNQRALFQNQIGPSVGGTDKLGLLMRQMQAGVSEGELRGRGLGAYVPTEDEVRRLDEFVMAQNRLALEFGQLKADLGTGVIPLMSGFIGGVTDFVGVVRDGLAAVGNFAKGLGITSAHMEGLGRIIGTVAIPALIALGAVLLIGFSPVLAIILAVTGVVLALLAVLGQVGLRAKETGDNLNYLAVAWKGADFPGMGGAAKAWGDATENAFHRVSLAKDAFIRNLAGGWAFQPIPILVTFAVSGADAVREWIKGLQSGIEIPVSIPMPDLNGWKAGLAGLWERVWQSPLLVPAPALAAPLVSQWVLVIRGAWAALWSSDGPLVAPAPAFANPVTALEAMFRSIQLAWASSWVSYALMVPLVQWAGTVNIPRWIADNIVAPWNTWWAEHNVLKVLANVTLPSLRPEAAATWARQQADTAVNAISGAFSGLNASGAVTAGLGGILVALLAVAAMRFPGLSGMFGGAAAATAAAFGISFGGGGQSQAGWVAGAEGAIVNGPTMALIGEAGPEAVIPLARFGQNQELPANLGSGGRGLTIYSSFAIQGMDFSDSYQVERMARVLGDKIMGNVRTLSSVGQIA